MTGPAATVDPVPVDAWWLPLWRWLLTILFGSADR